MSEDTPQAERPQATEISQHPRNFFGKLFAGSKQLFESSIKSMKNLIRVVGTASSSISSTFKFASIREQVTQQLLKTRNTLKNFRTLHHTLKLKLPTKRWLGLGAVITASLALLVGIVFVLIDNNESEQPVQALASEETTTETEQEAVVEIEDPPPAPTEAVMRAALEGDKTIGVSEENYDWLSSELGLNRAD